MTNSVDKFLVDGCMRCKYGATPQCKVNTWRDELVTLRAIVLESGLNEEIKWSVPVYTHKGKNIVMVSAFKDYAFIGFFKGALMADKHQILSQQGNIQSSRIIKFTNTDDILKIKILIVEYIKEAIAIENSGAKVEPKKNLEPLPGELQNAFEQDIDFEKAFKSLTLGRQRGYVIYFSQPKQSQTRISRIEKCKPQIFNGIGLNDRYSS